MRVLIAEDDPGLRSVLERGLREQGYVVDAVGDGAAALRYLRAYEYATIILDWRMPVRSGMEVLAATRAAGTTTPVLMLTARDTTADRVAGLDAGADDYLVKPFAFEELLARLRALLRRPSAGAAALLTCGDLQLDPATRTATVAGCPVDLTGTELAIVELLVRRSPGVVDRRTIALQVWDHEADAVGSNTIDVHIARVRAKLSGSAAHVDTVRGVGYRMVTG